MSWRDPLAAIAREHLVPDIAQRWINLLRPAFALHSDIDGPVVGRLGGLPMLPDDIPWPVWKFSAEEPAAPLTYHGCIDCGAVPAQRLDIALPATGTLHFFADVASYEDEPYQHAGSRIYYVPAGADVRERPAPPTPYTGKGYLPLVYEPEELRAQLISTPPAPYSAVLCAAFWQPGEDYAFGEDPSPGWVNTAQSALQPLLTDEFREAVHQEQVQCRGHRLGGYAPPCQWPPENAMWPRSDYPFRDGDTECRAAGYGEADPARQPGRLLFNIKGGELPVSRGADYQFHWIIRPDDLTARRVEAAAFRNTRCG